MTAAHHIARETGISMVINGVLSLLFFLLLFGINKDVPVWGIGNYVFDFLPQGFMIGLMATLVPGLLTRKKMRAGALAPIEGKPILPRAIFGRAMLFAIGSAVGSCLLVGTMLMLSGLDHLDSIIALPVKVGYGALLAAIVTPLGLRDTMRAENPPQRYDCLNGYDHVTPLRRSFDPA